MTATPTPSSALGIVFISAGMVAISINDMLIKELSGAYPLHQMVFVRSAIGILFSLMLVPMEGGLHILKTKRPFLLAVFWGWAIFAELPQWEIWIGMALIISSGLFVFLREQQKARQIARREVNRRY